ncbi:MAG TPA: sigma-70 family RNA polymerase sigma factor [Phycisphaerae bacterium]|nr:sigma-70 family RNA polymerase sigma factor [Phycisphaerae bacterium]
MDDGLESLTDGELLGRYAAGDEGAFGVLVRRHVGMVYGAGRRMLGAGGGPGREAEDVVQAVFLLLAQRAGKVNGEKLGGWLHRVTGYCCRNVRKAEGRRRRREREAAAMRDETAVEAKGSEAGAVLDQGLRRLGEKERAAVVVRYLEGKTAREAGVVLGIGEDAAEKRAERGLVKLRRFFAGRGFVVPGAGVAGLLVAEGAKGAPVALAERVIGAVGVGASGHAAVIAKGAAKMMTWMKVKAAMAAGAGAAVGVAVVLAEFAHGAGIVEKPLVIGPAAMGGQRAMMVRWDVMTDEAGARRVAAALGAVKGAGEGVYAGSAGAVRAALAQAPEDVLLEPTQAAWASMNDAVGSRRDGDFGLEGGALGGGIRKAGVEGAVTAQVAGTVRARGEKGAVRLDLRGVTGEVTAVFNGPPNASVEEKFGYAGDVPVGDAVVFEREVTTAGGVKLMHLSVWEAFAANDAEYAYVRREPGKEVVERGVYDVITDADQAIAWNAHGKKNPDDVGAAWERKLSDGGIVRLVGVTRPGEWVDCWWDAEGRAVAWDPQWGDGRSQAKSADDAVAAVSVEDPSVSEPRGRGYGTARRQLALKAVGEEGKVTVGVSAGAWTVAGKVGVGEEVDAGGVKVKVAAPEAAFRKQQTSTGTTYGGETWVKWEQRHVPDVEVVVGVVDKEGKEVPETLPPSVTFDRSTWGDRIPEQRIVNVDVDDIGGYVVKWRKREWVTFGGFALMPKELPGGGAGAASVPAAEVVRADSPEGFMAAFREAALSGDAKRVRGLMVVAGDAGGMDDKYASLMAEDFASAGAVWSAAVKRFGEEEVETALGRVVMLPQVKPPEGMAWEVKGDRAKLVNEGRGNVLLAESGAAGLVKVKGQWRAEVSLGASAASEPSMAERLEDMTGREKEAAARRRAVAAGVEAGKFADAYQVRDALEAGQ